MMNDSDILMIIIIYRNTIELYGMVWYVFSYEIFKYLN